MPIPDYDNEFFAYTIFVLGISFFIFYYVCNFTWYWSLLAVLVEIIIFGIILEE